MDELYEAIWQSEIHGSKMNYTLHIFGDYLAEKNKYKSHKQMDAIHFYLVEKYKWLPSVVKSLSRDDILFLLEEEMVGWTLPPDAIRGK